MNTKNTNNIYIYLSFILFKINNIIFDLEIIFYGIFGHRISHRQAVTYGDISVTTRRQSGTRLGQVV